MTVTAISPGILPIGFFDVSDADLPNISGGEILVFDVASSNAGETTTAEVYSTTARSNLRFADGYDTGPFFIASSDQTAGNIGFEKTSLYATNTAYAQTYDSSSKVGIYGLDGFYALTLDKFEAGTITTSTLPNVKLYPTDNGSLTTIESNGATHVGFFIEYRRLNTTPGYLNQPYTKFGMNKYQDTVIIYKSSGESSQTQIDLDRLLPETIGGDGYVLTASSGVAAWLPPSLPVYSNLNVPYAAQVSIDFTVNYHTITNIVGPLELITVNRAAVRSTTIFLRSGTIQPLTFPGSWSWLTSAAPTQLAANVLLVVTLTAVGANDSDVIAAAASVV